jgi:putative nucleotidyltransferase with HDIG domain
MNEHNETLMQRQMDSFPVLPATVAQILRVTGDPESSAADLMAVLLPDQSLCATVLKLANSALFGRPRRVDSLQAAIMVLGFNRVQSIALVKAMLNTFSDLGSGSTAEVERFWEHAFLTAMAANHMARDLGLGLGASFMAGLLHDLGKLVLLQTFGDDYLAGRWLNRCTGEGDLAAERQAFGFDHAAVGGRLLGQWQFPRNLVATASGHHLPDRTDPDRLLVQVVQLADLMAHRCQDEIIEAQAAHRDAAAEVPPGWHETGVPANDEQFRLWYDWLRDNSERSGEVRDLLTT